jgi:hypothetical protein
LKAPHSKCGILARVSGVRIPPSPPASEKFTGQTGIFIRGADRALSSALASLCVSDAFCSRCRGLSREHSAGSKRGLISRRGHLLLFLTMFHTDVVFALARGLRVGLDASPLVIAAVLATVRCSHRGQAAHARKQDKQSNYDDFHGNLLWLRTGPFFYFLPVVSWLVVLAVLSSAARNPRASFKASSFAQKCRKKSRGCSSSMWL